MNENEQTPAPAESERACVATVNVFGYPLPVPCADLERHQRGLGWPPVPVADMHDITDAQRFCLLHSPRGGRAERCVHHVYLPAPESPIVCTLCPHEAHPKMMCLILDMNTRGTCQCLSSVAPTEEDIAELRREYGVASSSVPVANDGLATCGHATLIGDTIMCGPCQDGLAALATVPVATEPTRELTFNAFRLANVKRCVKWHPQGIASWSPSDWLTAVAGELGELASLLKMRNRERDGLPGNKFSPTQKQIADELADVLTYLDLLAEVLGVNLGQAAAEKFNEVSERVGFPDRIQSAPSPSQPEPTLTIGTQMANAFFDDLGVGPSSNPQYDDPTAPSQPKADAPDVSGLASRLATAADVIENPNEAQRKFGAAMREIANDCPYHVRLHPDEKCTCPPKAAPTVPTDALERDLGVRPRSTGDEGHLRSDERSAQTVPTVPDAPLTDREQRLQLLRGENLGEAVTYIASRKTFDNEEMSAIVSLICELKVKRDEEDRNEEACQEQSADAPLSLCFLCADGRHFSHTPLIDFICVASVMDGDGRYVSACGCTWRPTKRHNFDELLAKMPQASRRRASELAAEMLTAAAPLTGERCVGRGRETLLVQWCLDHSQPISACRAARAESLIASQATQIEELEASRNRAVASRDVTIAEQRATIERQVESIEHATEEARYYLKSRNEAEEENETLHRQITALQSRVEDAEAASVELKRRERLRQADFERQVDQLEFKSEQIAKLERANKEAENEFDTIRSSHNALIEEVRQLMVEHFSCSCSLRHELDAILAKYEQGGK